MISKTHSPNSRKNNSRIFMISGGVTAALLLLICVTWQPAIDRLVAEAHKLPMEAQEKRLRSLSVISLRNDSVQKAQGDLYRKLNRYDLAGESLARGSSRLSLDAAHDLIESGRYDTAQKELADTRDKEFSQATAKYEAILAFNRNDTTQGCAKAASANTSDLQQACEWLKKGEVRGVQLYQLAKWQIYEPVLSHLQSATRKTAEDYLLLARITLRQRKLDESAKYLQAGLDSYPWRRDLAQAALQLCRQEGGGVSECAALIKAAEQSLDNTDLKF